MKKAQTQRNSWYSEKGTTEQPCDIPGHVALVRCGKLIAIVKAKS